MKITISFPKTYFVSEFLASDCSFLKQSPYIYHRVLTSYPYFHDIHRRQPRRPRQVVLSYLTRNSFRCIEYIQRFTKQKMLPGSTTKGTTCPNWCATHKQSWKLKCGWDNKRCSACPECDRESSWCARVRFRVNDWQDRRAIRLS